MSSGQQTCNGIPQRVGKMENIFEETMARKFSNLMKTRNLQTQESHLTLT